jgi:nucleoside-diphosphate-sugar epimerase
MAGELVLLTGATGFVGFLTLVDLLKAGYQVRAAIRSQSKKQKILEAPSFKALALSPGQLTWVTVPDMTADGAYDEAAKGVTYILHVASPIPSFGDADKAKESSDEMEETFLQHPVRSDLGMLQSAQNAGTVKRVVVTSSVVAITPFALYMGQGDYGQLIDDETRIADASGPWSFEFQAYSAGKARALNAMEGWVAATRPTFDLITVIPGWIFGRDELVADVASHTKGTTNSVLVNFLLGGRNKDPYNSNAVWGADVARVHVAALDPAVKGNQSFVVSTEMVWDDAHRVLEEHFADAVKAGKLSLDGEQPTIAIKVSGAKAEKQFGFTYKPYTEVVREVAQQYLELEAKA